MKYWHYGLENTQFVHSHKVELEVFKSIDIQKKAYSIEKYSK